MSFIYALKSMKYTADKITVHNQGTMRITLRNVSLINGILDPYESGVYSWDIDKHYSL